MPCTFVCVQMIVCLCDAFSTPQYPPTVIQSPRSSSSVAPKVTGGSGGDNEAGDTEPDDVEPSDVDVRFFVCKGHCNHLIISDNSFKHKAE